MNAAPGSGPGAGAPIQPAGPIVTAAPDVCAAHGQNSRRPCTCASYGGPADPATEFRSTTTWLINWLDSHRHWWLQLDEAVKRAERGLDPWVPYRGDVVRIHLVWPASPPPDDEEGTDGD